jgi:hypothetical protein
VSSAHASAGVMWGASLMMTPIRVEDWSQCRRCIYMPSRFSPDARIFVANSSWGNDAV